MKPIIKIAKNELRNIFYSPVAWFTIIVFFVMCGYFYTGGMYPLVKGYNFENDLKNPFFEVARQYWPIQVILTDWVFPSVFAGILQYLYLYVPLLTMGIISREFNNGTIRLLYSSPVKLRQVILGKYIALVIFNMVYVLIIGIFITEGAIDLRALEFGQLLSATLGVYLLLCALTAIGFFMSSLTTYQIVAAIASFAVLFVLKAIGGLWQEYAFARDITWFLSINNRTEWMLKGLIRSKDVVYYLVIIYMFVGFTLIKLRATRKTRPWYIKTARYLIIAVSGLLIGYVSARPHMSAYLDTTSRKTNTLLPETQKIIKELGDSTLEVTVYVNLLDNTNNQLMILPSGRNRFLDAWEPYIRFKPGIQFRFEYYYNTLPNDSSYYKKFPGKNLKEIATLIARGIQVNPAMFKSPEEMNTIIDLKSEGYMSVMQLKYRGRKTFLRFPPSGTGSDFWEGSTEPYFNAAFKRILGTKMPVLAFITGELERSIDKKGEREYSAQTSLVNLGFDFDTTNLAVQDITPNITTVVLADPKMDLSAGVVNKLRNYLNNGGNMLIIGEPKKQYVLNPLLQQLGIQLMPGQLVQPTLNETPDKVTTYTTPFYFNIADESFLRFHKNAWERHKEYYEVLTKTKMPGVVPIASAGDSGFTANPLFITKPWNKPSPGQVWLKTGKLVTDSAAPVFTPMEGDIKQDSFATGIQLTRQIKGKEQRIVVAGDADFMNNQYVGNGRNDMLIYSWLNYNQFPIFTHVRHSDNNITLISTKWAAMQKIVYIWIVPGILLVLATVLLVRRKRK